MLLAASLWILVRSASAQPAAPVERLREVEEERGRVEYFLRELAGKRADVLAVLEDVEREVRAAEKEARTARVAAGEARKRLAAAEAQAATIEREREAAAREMGPRLTLRYRLRGATRLGALFESKSIGDLLWRQRMVDRILQSDLLLAKRLDGIAREAEAQRARVEAEGKAALAAEDLATERARVAEGRRGVQREVLAGLGKERSAFERSVSELERQRGSLLEEMARMPPPAPGLGGFGSRRGRLPWPVEGAVEVPFGRQVDKTFGTVVQQKGVDLRAAAGEKVQAPHAAQVGFAGWFRGFGNLLVLDHGEGYFTLYAHLDELRVARGDRVDEGAVVGTVGDTGSLKGPYLYFEVRSGAKALDPAGWLAKR